MSLVTNQQQSVIDAAIDSYISTHDNVAYQYLKFRLSVLENLKQIQKEKLENGEVSEETLKRLQELKYENEKFKVSYPAYVDRLSGRIDFAENNTPQYVSELQQNYDELSKKNEKLKANLKTLREEYAPIVERMGLMVAKFEMLFASGRVGQKNGRPITTIAYRESAPNPKGIYLDYQSTVFMREELEQSLQTLDMELRNLKTVDEIDEGGEEKPQTGTQLHSIDTLKHLNELIDRSRALRRLGPDKVSFDLTRSIDIPKDARYMSVDEYEQTNQALARDIKDLVARGAIAKERWLANAKKLQAVDDMLRSFDESMEVD